MREFRTEVVLVVFTLLVIFVVNASCQDVPAPRICISQAAANQCRDNAVELPLQKKKVAVLEEALKEKDASIEELKRTGALNVADLRKRIDELTVELSFTKGQLSKAETQILWQVEVIKAMIPMLRKKGFINIF